jgi:thiamine monophosphate kinase
MKIHEQTLLTQWLGKTARSPLQKNALNEADCEIVKCGAQYLATTIDDISEEVSSQLYLDPETWGWMNIMASASDLCAVGAKPIGFLQNVLWTKTTSLQQKKAYQRGANAALKKINSYLLGGDSGHSSVIQLAAVGLGLCADKPILRTGLRKGDYLVAIGKFGAGPQLGLDWVLSGPKTPQPKFRPVPPFMEMQAIKDRVCSAMDVSDGIASTLSVLAALNRVGLDIFDYSNLFDKKAKKWCRQKNLPLAALYFAEHGDYQCIVGVRPENLKWVQRTVKNCNVLARVISRSQSFQWQGQPFPLDFILNSPKESVAEIRQSLHKWFEIVSKVNLP